MERKRNDLNLLKIGIWRSEENVLLLYAKRSTFEHGWCSWKIHKKMDIRLTFQAILSECWHCCNECSHNILYMERKRNNLNLLKIWISCSKEDILFLNVKRSKFEHHPLLMINDDVAYNVARKFWKYLCSLVSNILRLYLSGNKKHGYMQSIDDKCGAKTFCTKWRMSKVDRWYLADLQLVLWRKRGLGRVIPAHTLR